MASRSREHSPTSQLRSGPSGLPNGHVTEIQRTRLLAAAADTVDDVGYAQMTVAQVISRARVSRKTFYDFFADREDCFVAVFAAAVDRARAGVREECNGGLAWREEMRAGLARLLALMDAERSLARLCVVEALGAGQRALAMRAEVFDELVTAVDRGRNGSQRAREPAELVAESIVGGVFCVLHRRLQDGGAERGEPLTNLLGPLMSIIVLPYLGPRAADRELDRSRGRGQALRVPGAAVDGGDPLDGLHMRLTYRTVRVLEVIGEHPGASNREVAERAGIGDQGQISKLLARLARLGLAVNLGRGHERGAPNAWHLSARGQQLDRASRPR
jgi:AcrR family transcriptional regulator